MIDSHHHSAWCICFQDFLFELSYTFHQCWPSAKRVVLSPPCLLHSGALQSGVSSDRSISTIPIPVVYSRNRERVFDIATIDLNAYLLGYRGRAAASSGKLVQNWASFLLKGHWHWTSVSPSYSVWLTAKQATLTRTGTGSSAPEQIIP